jgi:hypothetical protein
LDNLAVLVNHAARDPSPDTWLTNWLRESQTAPTQDGPAAFETCVAAIRHSGIFQAWDADGHTLLFHAASKGNMVLAQTLIDLGAEVDLCDPLGWTPLHGAVRAHQKDMVEFLIRSDAAVQATVQDTSPFSPQSYAPATDEEGSVPAINALHIAVGIDPNQDRFSPDIVRLLLENGLDPGGKATNLADPRAYGVERDASPLQIMFRKWGAGKSADFFAVVQLLVDFGADVRGIAERFDVWDVGAFEGFERLWDVFRNADEEIDILGVD